MENAYSLAISSNDGDQEALQEEPLEILQIPSCSSEDMEHHSAQEKEVLPDEGGIENSDWVQNSWGGGVEFLFHLVNIGGQAAALLIILRMIVIPLLAVPSSPVSIVLAIAVGAFLVLWGVVAVINEVVSLIKVLREW